MFQGDKGWGDLAWDIAGLLPVGKVGKIFKGEAKFMDELVAPFKPGSYSAAGTDTVGSMLKNKDFENAFSKVITGASADDWAQSVNSHGLPSAMFDFSTSFYKKVHDYEGWADTLG